MHHIFCARGEGLGTATCLSTVVGVGKDMLPVDRIVRTCSLLWQSNLLEMELAVRGLR